MGGDFFSTLCQTEGVRGPRWKEKKNESKPGKHRIHSPPLESRTLVVRKSFPSSLVLGSKHVASWSEQKLEPDLCKSLQNLEVRCVTD